MAPEPLPTVDEVRTVVHRHLGERHRQILPSGEVSEDGSRFSWCGEVLDFLVQGINEQLAKRGITLSSPFPGPFRLWDEDRQPDGAHVRRFWTTALANGCPIARLCTLFHHRHDQVQLPAVPDVLAFPIDVQAPSPEDREDT